MSRPEPVFSHELYLLALAHIPSEDPDAEIMATMVAYMGPGCRGVQRLAARCRCRTQRVQLLIPRVKALTRLIAEHYTTDGAD